MKNLLLICDVSGSMSESGKPFILRNACRSVAQYYRLKGSKVNLRFWLVSNTIDKVDYNFSEDVPCALLNCKGEFNLNNLISELTNNDDYFILLTDGFWDYKEMKNLSKLLSDRKKDKFKIIKIGADSNPGLKGSNVYELCEIIGALDTLTMGV